YAGRPTRRVPGQGLRSSSRNKMSLEGNDPVIGHGGRVSLGRNQGGQPVTNGQKDLWGKGRASPQKQESIRQIMHDEVSRVNAQPKAAKSIEHPRTFSDEAAELSEITGASLDEPSNVRFLISELYSSRPKARELARQLLEQRADIIWHPENYYYF